MKILVDADSCPVKDIIINEAKKFKIKVILVANISHVLDSEGYAKVIIVDKRSQSADIEIANRAKCGDIIITNDIGLAALGLGRKCQCISPSGRVFNNENIDSLLLSRHVASKLRRSKSKTRMKGPKKRTNDDDMRFRRGLINLIKDNIK